MHGHGELQVPNEYTYKGTFKNGKYSGKGELISNLKLKNKRHRKYDELVYWEYIG